MKERFRTKTIRKQTKITLTDENGPYTWKVDNYHIINQCKKITEKYLEMGIPITLRQLYYDLVSENIIPNHEKSYKKISKLLTDARYLGLIDWDIIEDRTRPSSMHAEWADVDELLESAIRSYRLSRWSDQKYHIELLTEKDALSSILEPICDEWHVRYNVCKGYTSATSMYRLTKRLADEIIEEKQVRLLYIGDHDPSGLDMIRDVKKRVTEFLEEGDTCYDGSLFSILHLGLTKKQVLDLNPPPNPAKEKDPRAKLYIEKHGNKSWEVEALKPQYLRNLVNTAIKKFIDFDKYNNWIEREKKEKQEIKDFARQYKNN